MTVDTIRWIPAALLCLCVGCQAPASSEQPGTSPHPTSALGPRSSDGDTATRRASQAEAPRDEATTSPASPAIKAIIATPSARPTLDRRTPQRDGLLANYGASGHFARPLEVGVDPVAGHAFANREAGRTQVLSLTDGHLIGILEPLGPMVIDSENHRLFVDHRAEPAGLTVVDTRSLAPIGHRTLPSRGLPPTDDNLELQRAISPVFLPGPETLLIFRGRDVIEVDPRTQGAVLRHFAPLAANPRVLLAAAGTPDGRTLFVSKHIDEDPIYDVNTEVAAVDIDTGETLWRRTVYGHVRFLVTWDDNLLTASGWGRGDGHNLYLWNRDGLSIRSEGWPTGVDSAFHDRESGRVIVLVDQFIEQDLLLALSDDGLNLRQVANAPTNARIWANAGRDRWLLMGDDGTGLVATSADLFDYSVSVGTAQPSEGKSHGSAAASPSWPQDRVIIRATRLPEAVQCFDGWYARHVALSQDLGATWLPIHGGLPVCHYLMDQGPLLAPSFPRDRMMFLQIERLGVFRYSEQDSVWRPASDGLRALAVHEIVLSPHFEENTTLIALSDDRGIPINVFAGDDPPVATAWISRDAGDAWQPLGRFEMVAFSPNAQTPRRLYGFREGERVLEISEDMGATWHASGQSLWNPEDHYWKRAPMELMVIPSEDSTGDVAFVRIADSVDSHHAIDLADTVGTTYRSTDAGQTWNAVDVPLPAAADRMRIERKSGSPILLWVDWVWDEDARRNFRHVWRSEDIGATWHEVAPPASLQPIRKLSPLADGTLLVTAADGSLHVLPLESLIARGQRQPPIW